MSKAVLVMDMPEDCGDCPVVKFVNGHFVCQLKKNIIGDVRKPDFCPLRPMPEKKNLQGGVHDIQGMAEEIAAASWNACIDAIGGGDGD